MLKHLKLKKEIKIKAINYCLSLQTMNEKLLDKYKAVWTKVEDLKNLALYALPVHDDRCIKTKIRTYSDKV